MSARLDTSHLAKFDRLRKSTKVELSDTASAYAPAPSKEDNVAENAGLIYRHSGITPWKVTYRCRRSSHSDTKVYTAPTGYKISWVEDVINESRHGSTNVTISSDRKSLNIEARASGHACFEVLGCIACEPVIEQRTGLAKRQVRVHLESIEANTKVGEDETLLITTRGLCCCSVDGTRAEPQGVVGLRRLADPYGVQRMAETPGTRVLADQAPDDDAGPDTEAPPPVTERTSILAANDKSDQIRQAMIETAETQGTAAVAVPYSQTDHFIQALTAEVAKSSRAQARLAMPAVELPDIHDRVTLLAEALEVPAEELSVSEVLHIDAGSLETLLDLGPAQVASLKLHLLGVPLTSLDL